MGFFYYCSLESKQTYISKGSKALWKLIFPAICFTLAIYIAFTSYTNYVPSELTSASGAVVVACSLILPLVVLGIVFSMVKDFHFDFKNKRYKIVKRVGPLTYGKWRKFETLNYLSVFENLDGLYDLKLWYNENKHYSIDIFKRKQDAIEVGKDLAQHLSIDFYTPNTDYVYQNEETEPIEIPEDERTIDAHISEGKRPFWQILIAALFYIGALVSLYFFYETFSLEVSNKKIVAYFDIFELTIILFMAGISFSVVKDYQFDFKNNQYKIIHRVGPIKVGQWRTLKSLDYISVFKKNESKYLVNLWYNKNKHFNLSAQNKADTAIFMGKELAKKLKIELYDATDPHNPKWVDNLKT